MCFAFDGRRLLPELGSTISSIVLFELVISLFRLFFCEGSPFLSVWATITQVKSAKVLDLV